MELTIRPYRPADERSVIRLWQECGLVVPQNNPKLDIERKLRVNPDWLLVGELAGEVVATCMVGYEGHRGWINYLAVAPSLQRKGCGAQMMGRAEALLASVGCAKINLQVRSSNQRVMEFYRRIGFSVDEVIGMGKRLEQDPPYEPAR